MNFLKKILNGGVDANSTAISLAELADLRGQVAAIGKSQAVIEFDLNGIAAGTYILKQISKEAIQYSKIIVY